VAGPDLVSYANGVQVDKSTLVVGDECYEIPAVGVHDAHFFPHRA
jgi:hypothetical protein